MLRLTKDEKTGVRLFWDYVERKAEKRMLKTGKLEGAHYLSALETLKELDKEDDRVEM